MKTKKFLKSKLIGSMSMVIISLLLLCTLTYGWIAHIKSIDGIGKIKTGDFAIIATYPLYEDGADLEKMSFTNAGDIHIVNFTITNDSSYTIFYFIQFQLTNPTSTLIPGIDVYLNDEYAGDLVSLVASSSTPIANKKYTMHAFEELDVELRFEYHIGITEYLLSQDFGLTINIYAQQMSLEEELFYVYSLAELQRFASQSSSYDNLYIKLANDIVIDSGETVNFVNNATLDLDGHNLKIQGNLNFLGSGISKLISSVSSQSTIIGNVRFNNSNGLLMADKAYTSNIILSDFSSSLLKAQYQEYLKNTVGDKVQSDFDIMGQLGAYLSYFELVLGKNTTLIGTTLKINKDLKTVTSNISYKINGQSAEVHEFQIIGNSATVVWDSVIVPKYFSTLFNNETQNATILSSSMYLPTYLKEYNCHIDWFSVNPEILSHKGVFSIQMKSSIQLLVKINLNGEVFQREYNINVVEQSNQEKLQYLIDSWGDLNLLDVGYDHADDLPTLLTYMNATNTDLGIKSISYSYDTSRYNFLSILDGKAYLNNYTAIKYLPINLHVVFENETAVTYTGEIGVLIAFGAGGNAEEIINEISSYLSYNTMYDFDLPTELLGQYLYYYIPNDIAGDKRPEDMFTDTEIINSIAGYKMVSVDDNGHFSINLDYGVPIRTVVYIIVQIGEFGARRVMEFGIEPVIAYNDEGTGQIKDLVLFNALKSALGITETRNYFLLTEVNNATFTTFPSTMKIPTVDTYLRTTTFTTAQNPYGTPLSGDITSFEGLQYFTKIQILGLNGSGYNANQAKASDLTPLKELKNLKVLYLSNFNITNLYTIQSLPIEYVYLAGNTNLKDVTPMAYWTLRAANCYGTGVTEPLGKWAMGSGILNFKTVVDSSTMIYYHYNTGTYQIQTGSGKDTTAIKELKNYNSIGDVYSTLILPRPITSTFSYYVWTVDSGSSSNIAITYLSENAGTISCTITRPASDKECIIYFTLAENNSNFASTRPFFITLKGAGSL